ncbi:hypothetical protein JOC33_004139 [Thalassobacillus pellis]|nr:hypothetical protein [Thalassobacillus pellis]
MRRGYGREVYALTRGSLSDKRSTLRNLLSDGKLNRQMAAEVIVLLLLEGRRKDRIFKTERSFETPTPVKTQTTPKWSLLKGGSGEVHRGL